MFGNHRNTALMKVATHYLFHSERHFSRENLVLLSCNQVVRTVSGYIGSCTHGRR